jgi:nucleoside-diphosphate-sugar epimerase
LPAFTIHYKPDSRQLIADSGPASVDDRHARHDWGWMPEYDLAATVKDMLEQLQQKTLQ